MTTIFGHNEAASRMKRETMDPQSEVPIDHDFYSENPEAHCKKKNRNNCDYDDDQLDYQERKDKKRERHSTGDMIGRDTPVGGNFRRPIQNPMRPMMGVTRFGMRGSDQYNQNVQKYGGDPYKMFKKEGGECRDKKAIGGAAKVRKHYPFT